MPWGEKRPNGLYRAGWREGGKVRHSQAIYLTKHAAESAAWSAQGAKPLPTAGLTWSQWKDLWLPSRWNEVAASTRDGDEGRIRKWIEPEWGAVQLSAITTVAVRAWIRRLRGEGVSSGSLEKIYRLLSASLRDAVEDEKLASNPCSGIKLPPPEPGHERWLEPEQVDAAVDWMERPYSIAVQILAETGLRFGELAGLHWQRVDLRYGRCHIVEAWSRAGSWIEPYPKGRKLRTIPLSDRAQGLLGALPRLPGTCGQLHHGGVACRSTLVLPGPLGVPLDSHNMRDRHWLPALKLAGIDHARQHDLRHSHASWLAQAGVALTDIAEMLGHSDAYVTARYKHMANRHLDRVRDALNGVRSDLSLPDPAPSAVLGLVSEA